MVNGEIREKQKQPCCRCNAPTFGVEVDGLFLCGKCAVIVAANLAEED